MENRPTGRGKNVTGKAKGFEKRGDGLQSSKPAGKDVSYSNRRPAGSQGFSTQSSGQSSGGNKALTRGLSGGSLILVVAAIFILLKLCGGNTGTTGSSPLSLLSGLGGLMGGGSSSSASSGLDVTNLLGGFSGGSTVSTGWDRTANTGSLDSTVASGARQKYTQLLGNGRDTVTIMIYMCGTDLESKSGMASNDLQEMASATIGTNVNILVYTGGCKQWRISGISNSVNQIYKVENGNLVCLVANDGTDSLVKPATLTRFIQYCTKNYPANRQALIFWDHGGGSISGYGYDEKNASLGSMGLSGIDTALKNAGTRFDFIGFDACLMATLETGLMLDNYADYMIASEETEPGIGWYYTNWVTALSRNPSMPTIELGKQIVDDFVAECNRRCAGQKTTLSVVDLAELSATVPTNLKSFAKSTSQLLSGTDYKTVSDARSSTREFATSSKIDQVDLVHLCYNLGTPESEALAKSLLGAVKYNKTSSAISNAYGISIYFPYQRTSYVKTAVSTYNAIGLDSEYSRCIQQFATLETGGQQSSSSGGFDVGNLLGGLSSASGSSGFDVTSLLGGLLGGGLGREIGLTEEAAADTLTNNRFDANNLVWTREQGHNLMRLSEEQWSQVHDLQLNVFYNDGEGFINLGLDNMYTFTTDGALVGEYDCTWVAIDNQPVMFNYQDVLVENGVMTTTGTVPVLLNGERADLLVIFTNDLATGDPLDAVIAGAVFNYGQGSADAPLPEAKVTELTEGDSLEFICDYYSYSGEFQDSYVFGDPMTYSPDLVVGYADMGDMADRLVATYVFTDLYNNEHWTAPMDNVPLD